MDYDVVIVGGALAGSATARLIQQGRPETRILILERSERFERRVGESTVEVSSHFLGRELGLAEYLNHEHLVKQGLRFWFCERADQPLESCSEIGSAYHVRLPGYQIDRATLDEEVLRQASAQAEVRRGVIVKQVDLDDPVLARVRFRRGETTEEVSARWLVDASGRSGLLSVPRGWRQTNEAHPTATIWARWQGCTSLDDPAISDDAAWHRACHGTRGTATNHFMGRGWWAWCIPLKGRDTSIGVVYDTRLIEPPEGLPAVERLRWFLDQHPVARRVIRDARPVEGDVHARKQLAYSVDTVAGSNFAIIGDAAGFIDPFYSPGLDWVAFTAQAAAGLIVEERRSARAPEPAQLAAYNARFRTAYRRWFEAVYRDKYHYMGDFELMRLAFQLDLGLYYIGMVRRIFQGKGYGDPPFTIAGSALPFGLMRAYNRSLARIAQERRSRGQWGRANSGRRFKFNSFTLDGQLYRRVLGLVLRWVWRDLASRLRSLIARRPQATPAVVMPTEKATP